MVWSGEEGKLVIGEPGSSLLAAVPVVHTSMLFLSCGVIGFCDAPASCTRRCWRRSQAYSSIDLLYMSDKMISLVFIFIGTISSEVSKVRMWVLLRSVVYISPLLLAQVIMLSSRASKRSFSEEGRDLVS